MPIIKSNADLRNNYNEISTFCHDYSEPIFISKNVKNDLVVMSIESYEELISNYELYTKLKEGLDDVKVGNVKTLSQSISDIKARRKR